MSSFFSGNFSEFHLIDISRYETKQSVMGTCGTWVAAAWACLPASPTFLAVASIHISLEIRLMEQISKYLQSSTTGMSTTYSTYQYLLCSCFLLIIVIVYCCLLFIHPIILFSFMNKNLVDFCCCCNQWPTK